MKTQDDKVKEFLDLITLGEAAKLRGVTRAAISYLISKGRIESKTLFGRVLVNRNDVINYKPLPAGRPPSKQQPKGKQSSQAKSKKGGHR